MNDETLTRVEEFFDESKEDNVPAIKGGARGRKSQRDPFTEAKIKMVMRIYGVSRKDALGIIAGRKSEKDELLRAKKSRARHGGRDEDEGLMTAEDFFGA